jgi:hypothetical protein
MKQRDLALPNGPLTAFEKHADHMELVALLVGEASLETHVDQVAEAGLHLPETDEEDPEDHWREVLRDGIRAVLTSRTAQAHFASRLEWTDPRLLRRATTLEEVAPYCAVLIWDTLANYEAQGKRGHDAQFAELFERIVEHAAAALFGGRTYRFGDPPESHKPKNARERLKALGAHLQLKPYPQAKSITNKSKDMTLDVVAQSTALDVHSGQFFVLIQCSSGKRNGGKRREPEIERWTEFMDWGGGLVRAIAFANRLGNTADYRRFGMQFKEAIVLDTLRLFRKPFAVPNSVKTEAAEWCRKKAATLSKLS